MFIVIGFFVVSSVVLCVFVGKFGVVCVIMDIWDLFADVEKIEDVLKKACGIVFEVFGGGKEGV